VVRDVVVRNVMVHDRLGGDRRRHAGLDCDFLERDFVEWHELERDVVERDVVERHELERLVVERQRLELTR
jgi:hypothetical protein